MNDEVEATTEFEEILKEFESIPEELKSASIFNIAGYPHYENVSSNILAFYFNPNAELGIRIKIKSKYIARYIFIMRISRNIKNTCTLKFFWDTFKFFKYLFEFRCRLNLVIHIYSFGSTIIRNIS